MDLNRGGFLIVLLIVLIGAAAYAQVSYSNIPNPGHGANTIQATYRGSENNLQTVLTNIGTEIDNAPSGDKFNFLTTPIVLASTYSGEGPYPSLSWTSLDLVGVLPVPSGGYGTIKAIIINSVCFEHAIYVSGAPQPTTPMRKDVVCSTGDGDSANAQVIIPVTYDSNNNQLLVYQISTKINTLGSYITGYITD